MMDLVEQMVGAVATDVNGRTTGTAGGNTIDFAPPWRGLTRFGAIRESTGLDLRGKTEGELKEACKSLHLDTDGLVGSGAFIDEIFSEKVEPSLIQPTFILDYPIEMSPLAKKHRSEPGLVERFEVIVNGQELCNAFTEPNDPTDQRARFEEQMKSRARGDLEAQVLDEDFLRALEYGMPRGRPGDRDRPAHDAYHRAGLHQGCPALSPDETGAGMTRRFPVTIALTALLLATASLLFAGTTGILEGTVVDRDTRETLIGVSVSIVGTGLGAATDAEGRFQVNNVESGTYDVRITNIGYQPVVYREVVIRPDLRTKITIEMVQSAVELEAVEVIAERPLIQKDVTSTNFSISSKQVDRLPVKNVADLLALFPSVTAEGNVRGGKASEVVYLVDGLPMQDLVGGGIGGSLPKSAIREFSVQSGGFEAEYGNALSGVVNIITRRGGSRHSAIARVEKDNWLPGAGIQTNRATETELTLSPVFPEKLSYLARRRLGQRHPLVAGLITSSRNEFSAT